MASLLWRLYKFAKSSIDAKENFTTEALAEAIRNEPGPILHALQRLPRSIDVPQAAKIRVESQAPVGNGRQKVDLSLTWHNDKRDLFRVWFEIKCDSGASGNQFQNYAEAAAQSKVPHELVLLAHHELDEAIYPESHWQFLSWQDVWHAIDPVFCDRDRYWTDFKNYLEDNRMADNFDAPLTVKAGDVEGARTLIGKTARLLAIFAKKANKLWPAGEWEDDYKKIRETIAEGFVEWATLGIDSKRDFKARVSAGIWSEPPNAELYVMVYAQKADAFRKIETLSHKLGKHWIPCEGDKTLVASKRIDTDEDHKTRANWLIGMLAELNDVGILKIIPRA